MATLDADLVARKLGYACVQDLILHLPMRYLDETHLTPLRDVRMGVDVQVEGIVVHAEVQNRPRRQLLVEIAESAAPASSHLHFRLLHFYPSQLSQLQPGVRVRLFGEVRPGFFGAEMVHPQMRVVRENTPLPATLTPVYPAVAAFSQNAIRKAVEIALQQADLSETLPDNVLEKLFVGCGYRRVGASSERSEPHHLPRHEERCGSYLTASYVLPSFADALRALHHPQPDADLNALETQTTPAWQRIKFDELLAQQLSLRLAARQRDQLSAVSLAGDGGLSERLLAALPFALTAAQGRSLQEIRRDLARPHPMNRLLQGDVGSGKTLVAALTLLPALAAGGQVAVMAPTEILAEQLFLKMREWLQPLGMEVAWVAAALKGKAKKENLARIAAGEIHVAVGTHALFQAGVSFANLTLTIVDEQHRFGVGQRLALREKGSEAGQTPHLLMMSATPIPRSLAMSYYADLDVSVIDELPPGRTPIATKVLPLKRRDEVVGRLRDYCQSGAQAYWVCPLVEESEKLQLRAAEESHVELTDLLPELNIGLVHGRMKSEEKAAVMAAFKAGEIHLLVATTVIEVGVDVPNAALMVIEHAERYGLAQLHQLRGRVGRGARLSTCLLLYGDALSDSGRQRLRIIKEHADGFAIAREDLKLRGPGEFMGARQSGQQILRFANLETDLDLLQAARDVAEELLTHQPEVADRHLARWLPRGLDYLRA
ncbi:MAG: ATP-dependent DNA helicase RecG [Pseudomonadota bacterium]|nr:ATP-dependent DNA helicase RecG [Pseudomonadota bacterium]